MSDRGAPLAPFVKERARDLGFELVGIASAEASEHLSFVHRWIEGGLHGEMAYLARPDALERRGGPRRSFPRARSVVVVGHVYGQSPADEVAASAGIIARYARGRDYHKVVKGRLRRLLRELQAKAGELEAGPVEGRIFVDTGPLLERELGRRAGLGWFGRNTMLIHPRGGSYFLLGALLLDIELDLDAPFEADRCGSCRACLDACPTGALLGRDAGGAPVMDARRCISYLTIEARGAIPAEYRGAIGNRVFGCDICQEVCPFNGRLAWTDPDPAYAARGPGDRPPGVEPQGTAAETAGNGRSPDAPAPHPGTRAPELLDLLRTALDAEAWEEFSRGSPIRRAGRAGFARNVCVALGNWASVDAIEGLTSALSDAEALIRSHAAWALGRIDSVEARSALESRLADEDHAEVRAELVAALNP